MALFRNGVAPGQRMCNPAENHWPMKAVFSPHFDFEKERPKWVCECLLLRLHWFVRRKLP
jgi:hypothetical protein